MELKTPQAQDVRKQLVYTPGALSSFRDLVQFLEASEYMLAQLMMQNKIWVGNPPKNPGGSGEIEFGLIPYWVHNPPSSSLITSTAMRSPSSFGTCSRLCCRRRSTPRNMPP